MDSTIYVRGQPVVVNAQPVGGQQPVVVAATIVAQPQAPVVAATIVAQPAVPAGPPLKTGDFLDGWSMCFNDCNSCCLAWCCPCFSYAKIVSSLQLPTISNPRGSWQTALYLFLGFQVVIFLLDTILNPRITNLAFCDGKPVCEHDTGGREIQTGDCCKKAAQWELTLIQQAMGFVYSVLLCYIIYDLRTKFRDRLLIPRNDCDDCCCSFFCGCCVLAQLDRHLQLPMWGRAQHFRDPGPHPGLAALGTAGGSANAGQLQGQQGGGQPSGWGTGGRGAQII